MTQPQRATLMPFLTVSNEKEAVAFYMAAFGARAVNRYEDAAGRGSSKLAIDDEQFCVADAEPENGNTSPAKTGTTSVRIVLQTRAADALFEKALALGAMPLCPMTTEADWRIGKLKDPFGHVWEIGYPL